jgi:hypothetical protein
MGAKEKIKYLASKLGCSHSPIGDDGGSLKSPSKAHKYDFQTSMM